MSDKFIPYQLCYWKDIRDEIYKINSELAEIIDEFNPNSKYPLIQAFYPFGAKICDNGKYLYPTNNGSYVDAAHHPDKIIQNNLNYGKSTIGLVSNKAIEIYVETPQGRTIPFKLFKSGHCFGMWEFMEQPQIALRVERSWSISSGARTLFMLPKIADTLSHARIQNYFKIKTHLPNNLFDDHIIFKEIIGSEQTQNHWNTEILYFTDKWLAPHPKNLGWFKLKEYWAREAWRQVWHWSNRINPDLNWETFIAKLTARKIKLKPFLLDILRHLIAIGCGTIPGFCLAGIDDIVAPVTLLQKIYTDIYELKYYAPLMMCPAMFMSEPTIKSIYYSLQMPTLPENPPEWKELPSAMVLLRELKGLMDIFKKTCLKWPQVQDNNALDFINCVDYNYFHSDKDRQNIIQPAHAIFQNDKEFIEQMKKFPNRLPPDNASFFRGCINIKIKNEN